MLAIAEISFSTSPTSISLCKKKKKKKKEKMKCTVKNLLNTTKNDKINTGLYFIIKESIEISSFLKMAILAFRMLEEVNWGRGKRKNTSRNLAK